MPRLELQCPHCRKECELALDEDSSMVLLNCPSCDTPLVHYHGQTFQVDAGEFRYLRERARMREAQGLVREYTDAEGLEVQHGVGEPLLERPVEGDDVLELHRGLEDCNTVEDILRLMG